MSDITEALTQDAIADSLINPAGAVPLPEDWGGHKEIREVATVTEDSFDPNLSDVENEFGDSLVGNPEEGGEADPAASAEELDEVLGDQAWRSPDKAQETNEEQPQQEQPQELTPAEVHERIHQLDQAVEQLGLNDQPAAQELAYSLTAPFGADPGSIDAKILGSTMSKVVLSAAQIHDGGNFENLAPISPEAAKAFTGDFLRAFGIDARAVEVDSQRLASTMLAGTLNFLSAVKTYGVNASLERLNTPEAAEAYVNSLLQALGQNQPASREHALRLADSFGKYVLSLLQKLPQPAPQQGRQARSQARSGKPSRAAKRSGSQFRTNRTGHDAGSARACRRLAPAREKVRRILRESQQRS